MGTGSIEATSAKLTSAAGVGAPAVVDGTPEETLNFTIAPVALSDTRTSKTY
jgi:hypothetical protein